MINFEKHTWYNKNDTENEAKRIPISATHLNRIEDGLEVAYKLTETVPAIAPYLAFVGNANANMVAAAFGKGNEAENIAIGKALKMYANFNGDTANLDFLDGYRNYTELVRSHKQNLLSVSSLKSLITSSTYAKNLLKNTNVGLPDIVLYDSGTTEYLNLDGANIACEKPDNEKSSYEPSMDLKGGVLTVRVYSPGGGDGNGNALAANCTIPLVKPLPDLYGYSTMHVKFADNIVSEFTNIHWLGRGYTYANIVVAGKSLKIPCDVADLDLTGLYQSVDHFDSYAKNPVENNIKIQLNFLRKTAEKQNAIVNIEKIWISEA